MTVADLIAALQDHPLDARVVVDGYEDGYDHVVGVVGVTVAEGDPAEWWGGWFQPASVIDPKSLYVVHLTSDRRKDRE